MLVDINLLPQKEPKNYNFIITLSCLVLSLLLISGYYLWQINSTKSEVASLNRQIATIQKVTRNQEEATDYSTNSVSQLKSAIEWANDYSIQIIPVMRHLTSLLPERGFIQSFGYTEAGTITLTVQFDSAREAAYFLDSLNESKWISEASLSSLAAAAPADSSTEAATTAQKATTSAATTQTNTTGTTASTTVQPNTTTPAQTTTGTAATSSNPASTTTTPTASQSTTANQKTTTNTQTNSTTGNTTTAAPSTAAGTNTVTNILPRYTGQFEIKLNTEYVKKTIKKSKKDEKGVTGS